MLYWAALSWVITLLIVAFVAGLLGFSTVAGVAVDIAKVVFLIFALLVIIAFALERTTAR